MNNPENSQNLLLDEQLAQFTDQALSEKGEEQVQNEQSESDLARLQKTILRLRIATKAARPGPVAAANIRKNVLTEWARHRMMEENKAKSQKRAIWWPFQKNVMALSGLALALLVFILVALPGTTPVNLNGTAIEGSASTIITFISLGIIIVIGIFLWFNRHK